jgi:phage FluMu gp28-like protein
VRDVLLAHTGLVYVGEDFARSGDLTCIFLDELLPDGRQITFLAIELRNVPFSQQLQVVLYLLNTIPRFGMAAFDSRGNGQMIAEMAAQERPGYVNQVMISTGWYAENFPKLKSRMEDATTTIPNDPFIREDFRVVGLRAGVPCVLERSGGPRERRHGDGAIAKLMAIYAAVEDEGKGYQPMTYEPVATGNRYRQGGNDLWDD